MLIVTWPAGSSCSEGDGLPPGLFALPRAEWAAIREWADAVGECPEERDLSSGAHGCVLTDDLCELVRRARVLREDPSQELADFAEEVGDSSALELVREKVAAWAAARDAAPEGAFWVSCPSLFFEEPSMSSSGSASDEGPAECANACYLEGRALGEGSCGCCRSPLYEVCAVPGNVVLEGWLQISNVCEGCEAVLCRECLAVCSRCVGAGSGSASLCQTCTPNQLLLCGHLHERWACAAHAAEECGTCAANRNYAAKTSF